MASVDEGHPDAARLGTDAAVPPDVGTLPEGIALDTRGLEVSAPGEDTGAPPGLDAGLAIDAAGDAAVRDSAARDAAAPGSCPETYQPPAALLLDPTLNWYAAPQPQARFHEAFTTYRGRTGYLRSDALQLGTTAALKFVVPDVAAGWAIIEWAGNINFGDATAAISSCPGDLSQHLPPGCAPSSGGYDVSTTGFAVSSARDDCQLEAGKWYYFNVRADQNTMGLQLTPRFTEQ